MPSRERLPQNYIQALRACHGPLKKSAKFVETFRAKDSTKHGAYNYNNSSLEDTRDIFSFQSTFEYIVPERPKNLRQYLENKFKAKTGQVVGIELGGPGSALFGGFSKDFFQKSLGVCLADRRKYFEPVHKEGGGAVSVKEDDDSRSHSVIETDIFTKRSTVKIREWLNGAKADIIFEKLMGGMNIAPKQSEILFRCLQNWYSLLSEKGEMYIQVLFIDDGEEVSPLNANQFTKLQRWAQIINQDYAGKIRVDMEAYVMRIEKLEGAPEKLPDFFD